MGDGRASLRAECTAILERLIAEQESILRHDYDRRTQQKTKVHLFDRIVMLHREIGEACRVIAAADMLPSDDHAAAFLRLYLNRKPLT